MQPKVVMQKEARDDLLENFELLENLGYTQNQIGTIVGDYKQVISNIKGSSDYPLGIKKIERYMKAINTFKETDEFKKLISNNKE